MAWWSSFERDPVSDSFPRPLMRLPRPNDPNAPAWLIDFTAKAGLTDLMTDPGLPSDVIVGPSTDVQSLVLNPWGPPHGRDELGNAYEQESNVGADRLSSARRVMCGYSSMTSGSQQGPFLHTPEGIGPAWEALSFGDGCGADAAGTLHPWATVAVPPLRFFLRDAAEIQIVYNNDTK
jgi:hypothetical protein